MSNITNTVNKCLDKESKMDLLTKHQSFLTCESSPVSLKNIKDLQTWLQQDSLASRFLLPGSATQKMMNAICGQQPSKLLDKYSRKFAFSRTCLDFCRLEKGEWRTAQSDLFADTSETYCETFPKAGTMRGGVCWEQVMLMVSTEESDYGSGVSEWATPRTCSAMQASISENTANAKFLNLETQVALEMYPTPRANKIGGYASNGFSPTLEQVVMLPTPQAADGTAGAVIGKNDIFFYNESGNLRKVNGKGTEGSAGLARKVMIENWPTPRSAKGMTMRLSQGMVDLRWKKYLETEVAYQEKAPGKHLNPTWTELLMMWPENWTSLKPLTKLNWDIDCSLWEQDIPRVKMKEKDHASRLKAIGNGQVPLCNAVAYIILDK